MSEIAIRAENLSKLYHIGQAQRRHDTLHDALEDVYKRLAGRYSGVPAQDDTFWALKDVSFEVQRGEAIGIIGRNGAGKSTLLKILSRITEPTSGRVVLDGRVASLLEVGTGFHPELTGRENIYLNGAILGMHKAEIDRRFDEIVAFAEIERFLDTPVKRYSSGMYVRLAFAVAAHLEPEILLVDEVLAVGDASFQRKCLGKMGDVAHEGRTVLFVSHNMAAVEALCPRAVSLQNGQIVSAGGSTMVIRDYLLRVSSRENRNSLEMRQDRLGSGEARFTHIRLLEDSGQAVSQISMGMPLVLEADYRVSQPLREPLFGFLITDDMGKTVMRAYTLESYSGSLPALSHSGTVRCRFDAIPLMYGEYSLRLWLGHHRNLVVDDVMNATRFEVLRKDLYGTGFPIDANNGGVCFAHYVWDFSQLG